MAVTRGKAVAVVHFDHLAVAAAPARHCDGAASGCPRGLSGIGADVEPGMHRGPAYERVLAHAEARSPFKFAGHRLADWHCVQRAGEPLDLSAHQLHAIDLAVEGGKVAGR